MSAPPVPEPVARTIARYPAPVATRLMEIRALIFAVAARTEGVGPLTEALKWGEPAYLTEASRSGTTIRLGATRSSPDAAAVLLNCRTSLVESFRAGFADVFAFEGNRAVIMPIAGPLPQAPLILCLRAALTYRRR
ncbi:hypothetical protein GCM10011321_02140 [Youhaiella tibetensis]|uniref:DUF1801 domain-containing protein n=1 Tax=Paradevosia tibetensis TaxID=1447062 RepID=A0A5B9DR77_9HYPH|nr:DUF1801 domain-containing protein [Youhaiella tibetensis]QEE21572.1 DUF1801 domain-containing protein [Youhaiella tibetensis]GGF13731.1 hypothetical protein GCM10011321_02140 [Youhaiella tibetensis]